MLLAPEERALAAIYLVASYRVNRRCGMQPETTVGWIGELRREKAFMRRVRLTFVM